MFFSRTTFMTVSPSAILRSLIVVGALALFAAPAALADSSTSTNWSGYVAHGKGAKFKYISALWTQPNATCTPGTPTYSAFWVGIGGYSLASQALEQIGTEVDCSASGKIVSTAWYELVPDPSIGIRMKVNPGDVIAGRVTVIGHHVTLTLQDRTRHTTFKKKVIDTTVDVSSADWIAEAPSECNGGGGDCQPLPLADYGSETFARARAETTKGQSSSVTSRHWRTTAITLSPGGRQYIGYSNTAQAESLPSPLLDSGSQFKLTYTPVTPPVTPTPPVPTVPTLPAQSGRATAAVLLQPGGARR
jgi:hypothetical protein